VKRQCKIAQRGVAKWCDLGAGLASSHEFAIFPLREMLEISAILQLETFSFVFGIVRALSSFEPVCESRFKDE
jgi:hypothetical protein